MDQHGVLSAFLLSALLLGATAASAADSPRSAKSPSTAASKTAVSDQSPKPRSKDVPPKPIAEARETLGEAFIAQATLRIYLGRPAVISLHNVHGQQLFYLESARPMEALPLAGINAGYLYLTLRSGNLEMTRKLVYAGR